MTRVAYVTPSPVQACVTHPRNHLCAGSASSRGCRRFPAGALGFVAARLTGSAFIGIGILRLRSIMVWTGIALAWRRQVRMARRAPEGEAEALRSAT